MYWPVPGSLRGGLSVRKHRQSAGKCDNLSFLRVFLSQMGEVLDCTNGYVPLLGGGWAGSLRELVFDSQQRIIRQPSLIFWKMDPVFFPTMRDRNISCLLAQRLGIAIYWDAGGI